MLDDCNVHGWQCCLISILLILEHIEIDVERHEKNIHNNSIKKLKTYGEIEWVGKYDSGNNVHINKICGS